MKCDICQVEAPSHYPSYDLSQWFGNIGCCLHWIFKKMATGDSFPHGILQFPAGVHNFNLLKAQFERNKTTIVLIEKRIEDLSRASNEVHRREIKALRIQLTAVRGANLAIKIDLDNIDNQAKQE